MKLFFCSRYLRTQSGHLENGVIRRLVLVFQHGDVHAGFFHGAIVLEHRLPSQADPPEIRGGRANLHVRIFLHLGKHGLLIVGAEPQLSFVLHQEHEGAALRLPIGTDRSQILDGICGKELNDFLHGSLSFSPVRFAGESI